VGQVSVRGFFFFNATGGFGGGVASRSHRSAKREKTTQLEGKVPPDDKGGHQKRC